MVHGFRFLPLVLLLVLLGCCKKDDAKPAIEQLPPATTTGANTFGCLVNGEAWKVTSTSTFGNRLVADWTVSDGLNIRAYERNGAASKWVSFYLPDSGTTTLSARIYPLTSLPGGNSVGMSFRELLLEPKSVVSGRLTLTRLDRTARICSGTFDFVMANGTDTLRVTDGRFDIRDMLL